MTDDEPGVVTLWDVRAGRWWALTPLVYVVGGVALTLLLGVVTRLNPWSLLAMLVVTLGYGAVRDARTRLRLTPEGLEVRGFRTRLWRWADIASVEVSPPWEGGRTIWVRLRGSLPQTAPEVLAPPPEWWHDRGHSLEVVVRQIEARRVLRG